MSTSAPSDIAIEACQSDEDIEQCFTCLSEGFGRDMPLLNALNPLHYTPDGRAKGVARLQRDWRLHRNDPTWYYVKAVIDGAVAGFAIWCAATRTHNVSDEDADKALSLAELYPDDARQQEWLRQVWRAYVQPRREAMFALPSDDARPVMMLELCVVRPTFQRRGVGVKLTQWGVDEAKRIGASKAIVEASVPGVGCYYRCGFVHQRPMDFGSVDADLQTVRPFPTLYFMQTDELDENQ